MNSRGPSILILRDPRESKKKCSLTPLEGMPGITFVPYARDQRLNAHGRILLSPEGELLTAADAGRDLLVLDSSWRRVPRLRETVDGELHLRRLPPLLTAYPRKSQVFADPSEGLASVEALYAALVILGHPRPELLDGYRWADGFLAANPSLMGGVPA